MSDWFEAEERVERAQQLCESQRWAEALAEIDAALAINPNHATWHANRGFVLEELDRWEEAVEAYEQSLDIEPDDRDVRVALGAALLRVERLARSIAVFDEVAARYPNFEPAYCHRVQAFAELGEHDRAEEMFYLAQQLNDSCPHCFYAIGISLSARGMHERAIYCWQRVVELEPNYFGVNQRIAQSYRARGEFERARDYFVREIRSDPGNTDLLFELAQMTEESGQIATAAAKFAQIIELEPDHIEARFALGRIWLRKGQPSRALSCFEGVEKLTRNTDEPPGFDMAVARALFQLRRFAEAYRRAKRISVADPADVEAAMLAADCRLAGNQAESAADWYRRALAQDGNNARAHHQLGLCLYRMNRYESGLEHCRAAVDAKPDDAAAMLDAVTGQVRLGRWRDAREMLRRCLAVDPANPIASRMARQLWRHRLRSGLRRTWGTLRRISGPRAG